MNAVDRQRVELEANMEKLEKALRHWQTWDEEYEGLKEELQELDDGAGADEINRIAADFGGELLIEKEIREIAGLDKDTLKDPRHIVGLVGRRQDYVQQNIRTISKQVEAIRITLAGADEESQSSEQSSGPNLPVTEIIEELDEDDNVISSKVTNPEETTANIIETLRKAGVKNSNDAAPTAVEKPKDPVPKANDKAVAPETVATRKTRPDEPIDGDERSAELTDQFSDMLSRGQETKNAIAADSIKSITPALVNGSFAENERVIELDDDDDFVGSTAVMPQDESPEDAQLRREMLNYHLNEVGNVVAEMDILDGGSDDDDYDDLEDLDDVSETSDISELEDEHGRSLKPAVTEDYRKQMQELERRLNGASMKNLGPEPAGVDVATPSTISNVVHEKSSLKSAVQQEPKKEQGSAKSVRFAADIDVSPDPSPKVAEKPIERKTVQRPVENPLSNTVMERFTTNETATQTDAPAAKPTKVSRFKQTQAAKVPPTVEAPQPVQQPQTLSNSVLERSAAPTARAPTEEDEFDPEVQQRQLTTEYYRLRNNMIREQGGFKLTEEDKEEPLMEEQEDGKVQKVSRFKAARLQR
ncbi:hypothetical protein C1H76_9141 [Elsinoe australis]|uniref:DUF3835 domain-containing protein n=1 Tax=Elsinoe australis TaxID=40998 RepID=A0A4U7AK73_9PEZI|nr:hypothetical protein C1H76_9141 [Elsinoe australis]